MSANIRLSLVIGGYFWHRSNIWKKFEPIANNFYSKSLNSSACSSGNSQAFNFFALLPVSASLSTMTSKDWRSEKERLSKLSIEERRKEYFCKDKYTPVSQIPTWREYYQQNEKSLSEKVSEKDLKLLSNESEEETGGDSTATSPSDVSMCDKVSIYVGDITKLESDAIVNAANKSLLGGGGVDGAIHRSAGDLLLSECKTLNGCETGEAKITSGYKLPAKNIIHTVGPIGEKPDLLSSCYQSSMELMKENNLRTIAFPCISTGIYDYPSARAAVVAIETVKKFIEKNPEKVDRVIFCLFLEKDVEIYEKMMQIYFPVKT